MSLSANGFAKPSAPETPFVKHRVVEIGCVREFGSQSGFGKQKEMCTSREQPAPIAK
jgi:hypothetical protein